MGILENLLSNQYNIEKESRGNITIRTILEEVRNNPVFRVATRDFKEQYFMSNDIHGIGHAQRVVILACYIGIKEGIKDEELSILLEAAKYHDIGRGYDGNHGINSAQILERNKEYILSGKSEREVDIIKALCMGHSMEDKDFVKNKIFGIEDTESITRLLNILKDADALERVRLPRYGKLNPQYLRTEISREMIDAASELFMEYKRIERESDKDDGNRNIGDSNNTFSNSDVANLISDGEFCYLIRSLNGSDIENMQRERGILPKVNFELEKAGVQVSDILNQVKAFHTNTGLISLTESPNVALTYNRTAQHRFVLVRIPQERKEENANDCFSVGTYLVNYMKATVEALTQLAPEHVRKLLKQVDDASTLGEVATVVKQEKRILNTTIIEKEQQYLDEEEQLEQGKVMAKYQLLYYYGLTREVSKGVDFKEFISGMRMAYSSAEWLHVGSIAQKDIIEIPEVLLEALGLIEQAIFKSADTEQLERLKQRVIEIVKSGKSLEEVLSSSSIGNNDLHDFLTNEYLNHNQIKKELTIGKAFEFTNGDIPYKDLKKQWVAIYSLVEMTLRKRAIIEILRILIPDIDCESLLKSTLCVNTEMTTRINNRGTQIGKNINLSMKNYREGLNEKELRDLAQQIDELSTEKLIEINENGVEAASKEGILKVRENKRLKLPTNRTGKVKYIAEAIVEGYNWGNIKISEKEKQALAQRLVAVPTKEGEAVYRLYEAIGKIEINNRRFTQEEIFAIIMNIAIDGRIGKVSYKELLNKPFRGMQEVVLDNRNLLQTDVLPISVNLFTRSGKETEKLKSYLRKLGVAEELVQTRDIRNLHMAKQIVEGYFEGQYITDNKKRVLIQCVISPKVLGTDGGVGKWQYLSTLVRNMQAIGLDKREIYGMIINLGVNETVTDQPGYSYTRLIVNQGNSCRTIAQYRNQIETKVSESTIEKAQILTMDDRERKDLYRYFIEELGLGEFINDENGRPRYKESNLYMAKQIVEGYFDGYYISDEERKALVRCVLMPTVLRVDKKGKCRFLITLSQEMEKRGLKKQQIYGMIINSAVNGSAIKTKGYDYDAMLRNKNGACGTIPVHEINTKVSQETISKALTKKKYRISGRDMVKACGELLVPGSGGSELCDSTKEEYTALMEGIRGNEDGVQEPEAN